MQFMKSSLVLLGALTGLALADSLDGQMTIYTSNGTNACGRPVKATDKFVAIPTSAYGDGRMCGMTMRVNYNGTGGSATIVDKCDNCTDDCKCKEGIRREWPSTFLDLTHCLLIRFSTQGSPVLSATSRSSLTRALATCTTSPGPSPTKETRTYFLPIVRSLIKRLSTKEHHASHKCFAVCFS